MLIESDCRCSEQLAAVLSFARWFPTLSWALPSVCSAARRAQGSPYIPASHEVLLRSYKLNLMMARAFYKIALCERPLACRMDSEARLLWFESQLFFFFFF